MIIVYRVIIVYYCVPLRVHGWLRLTAVNKEIWWWWWRWWWWSATTIIAPRQVHRKHNRRTPLKLNVVCIALSLHTKIYQPIKSTKHNKMQFLHFLNNISQTAAFKHIL